MSNRVKLTIDKSIHIATITLNDPNHLNSLTFDDFMQVGEYLDEINEISEIYITILQSSGRMFSSGGKFEAVAELKDLNPDKGDKIGKLKKYLGNISTPTIHMLQKFSLHKNPIICNLNGPAVGLSACMVMLCDMVNIQDNNKPYLLFPFTSLGFVTEAGSSVTLYENLGINLGNEHLILSKPIKYETLKRHGFIWKEYSGVKTTEEFNSKVEQDIITDLKQNSFHPDSITEMRRQLIYSMKQRLKTATVDEIMNTLPLWMSGEPHHRFELLSQKKRRHKL